MKREGIQISPKGVNLHIVQVQKDKRKVSKPGLFNFISDIIIIGHL